MLEVCTTERSARIKYLACLSSLQALQWGLRTTTKTNLKTNHTPVSEAGTGSQCHGSRAATQPRLALPIHLLASPLDILQLRGKPYQLTYLVKAQPSKETTCFSV